MFPQKGDNKRPDSSISKPASEAVSHIEEIGRLLQTALKELRGYNSGRALNCIMRAVEISDTSAISSNALRADVREQAAYMLNVYGEVVDAERYLTETIQLRATNQSTPMEELHKLRTVKAEMLGKLGRFDEARSLWSYVGYWVERHAPNSLLEKHVLIGQANLASREGDLVTHGRFMVQLFNTISTVPKESRSELVEMLVEASADEEAEGRFKMAGLLVREALLTAETNGEPPETTEIIRLKVAAMAHKAGDFAEARVLRTKLLREIVEQQGDSSQQAVEIRIALAETLVELNEFEAAENMLRVSLDICLQEGYDNEAMQSADTLTMLYGSRNLHAEAREVLASIADLVSNMPAQHRLLLRAETSVAEKAFGGDLQGACQELEKLLCEARELQGIERACVEGSILASLVCVYLRADTNTERAREYLNLAYDAISNLPSKFAEGVLLKVRDVEAQLANMEQDPERVCKIIQSQMDSMERMDGRANFNIKSIMLERLGKAQYNAGKLVESQQTMRGLKVLLESRNDLTSMRYARALIALAQLLPEGDSEIEPLIEKALPILQRHKQEFPGFN